MDHNDFNLLLYLGYAEIALWAYFLIQLGLCIMRIDDFRAFFKREADEQASKLYGIIWLKRAGFALLGVGVVKLVAMLYAAFI